MLLWEQWFGHFPGTSCVVKSPAALLKTGGVFSPESSGLARLAGLRVACQGNGAERRVFEAAKGVLQKVSLGLASKSLFSQNELLTGNFS